MFTPGPWEVDKTAVRYAHADETGYKPFVARMAINGYIPSEVAAENARLIAAAPDMLSVLESVLHQLSTDSDLDDRVSAPGKYDSLERIVREVISKTKG